MAADLGIDQVKIYGFDSEKGTISQVDAVRCELESAPRQFVFSKDGRFFYLMYQLKNAIDVYSYEYEPGERVPKIERLQTVSSTDTPAGELTAACAIRMSPDDRYLFCSNAGDNCVSIYERGSGYRTSDHEVLPFLSAEITRRISPYSRIRSTWPASTMPAAQFHFSALTMRTAC